MKTYSVEYWGISSACFSKLVFRFPFPLFSNALNALSVLDRPSKQIIKKGPRSEKVRSNKIDHTPIMK